MWSSLKHSVAAAEKPPSLMLHKYLSLSFPFASHFPHKSRTIQFLEGAREKKGEIMILVAFSITLLEQEEKSTVSQIYNLKKYCDHRALKPHMLNSYLLCWTTKII